jgi:hypothetical protein
VRPRALSQTTVLVGVADEHAEGIDGSVHYTDVGAAARGVSSSREALSSGPARHDRLNGHILHRARGQPASEGGSHVRTLRVSGRSDPRIISGNVEEFGNR